MESSLPVFAGANIASNPLDGRLAGVLATGSPVASADGTADGTTVVEAVDERDSAEQTEFWDACWTLEDEWIPRAVVPAEPRSRRVQTASVPTVFALL